MSSAEQRARNRDNVRAWRERNPEASRAQARASYARAAEVRRANARAYYQRERKVRDRTDEGRLRERLRKQGRRGAGALDEATWIDIVAAYDGRCAYCFDLAPLQVDHVVPVSRGGRTEAENIAPACVSCNSAKGARTPAEWLR